MGLREDLEREMGEAAERTPFALKRLVYGSGQAGDDAFDQIKEVVNAQLDALRILKGAVLRLADEVEALK